MPPPNPPSDSPLIRISDADLAAGTSSDMMSSTKLEVQREIAAHLEQERARKETMLCVRGVRACSEQGPHPGHHLWGTRRSRKRTSAPQMGTQGSGVRTALILRSRRSWPVAPVTQSR